MLSTGGSTDVPHAQEKSNDVGDVGALGPGLWRVIFAQACFRHAAIQHCAKGVGACTCLLKGRREEEDELEEWERI